jgi:hypothetical protein
MNATGLTRSGAVSRGGDGGDKRRLSTPNPVLQWLLPRAERLERGPPRLRHFWTFSRHGEQGPESDSERTTETRPSWATNPGGPASHWFVGTRRSPNFESNRSAISATAGLAKYPLGQLKVRCGESLRKLAVERREQVMSFVAPVLLDP